MRKNVFFIALTFLFFVIASFNLLEAGNIPASQVFKYEVTIKKVELFNSTTNSWVTLASTPKTFDIASVNAGATVGDMISGIMLPQGTYTQMKVTIGNQFKIRACGSSGSNCTNGGTWTDPNSGLQAAVASGNNPTDVTLSVNYQSLGLSACSQSSQSSQCYTDNGDLVVTQSLGPFTVTQGNPPTSLSIVFNLDNVFTYSTIGGTNIINPGAPDVKIGF